jgi:hypothetical protein
MVGGMIDGYVMLVVMGWKRSGGGMAEKWL